MKTDPTTTWFEYLKEDHSEIPEIAVHATIAARQEDTVPMLLDSIDRACGWVLHRTRLGVESLQIRLEIQGRHLMDMYAAMAGVGLEFTRDSQLLLNDRCTCVRHNANSRRAIQPMRLDVSFTDDDAVLRSFGRVAVA